MTALSVGKEDFMFVAIAYLLGIVAYVVFAYMRFKVLAWWVYRYASDVRHRKGMLAHVMVLAGISYALLWGLGRLFEVSVTRCAEGGNFEVFAIFYVFIMGMLVLRIAYREILTLGGIHAGDWNWKNPRLGLFHIPRHLLPEKSSRRGRSSFVDFLDAIGPDNSKSKTGMFDDYPYYRYYK